MNHLIQIRTSEWVCKSLRKLNDLRSALRINSQSEIMVCDLLFRLGLQSADHKSFDYDRNFRMGLQIFLFTLELRSVDHESLLLKIRTSEWVHKSFHSDQNFGV